jgi:hypothetical protein
MWCSLYHLLEAASEPSSGSNDSTRRVSVRLGADGYSWLVDYHWVECVSVQS